MKKFVDDRGFGFIENADGSGDVFVHFMKVNGATKEDMIVGSEMTFDIEEDERTGKTCAVNVTITTPGTGKSGGGGGGGPAPVVAAEPTLADAIHSLAWASKGFRKSWVAYCKLHGEGVNNPADHEEEFLTSFADYTSEALNAAMDPNSAKKRAAGEADGEAPAKKKVTMKKAVVKTIQRLNKFGGLLAPIRLPAVAAALAQVDEAAALKALNMLEEQAGDIENPNEFLKNHGSYAAENAWRLLDLTF